MWNAAAAVVPLDGVNLSSRSEKEKKNKTLFSL